MPYEKNLEKLDTLVAEALKAKEIREGMQETGLTEGDLTSKIKEKSSEIWEAGAKESEEFNHLERKRKIAEEELSKASYPKSLIVLEKIKSWMIKPRNIVIIVIIVILFAISYGVAYLFHPDWVSTKNDSILIAFAFLFAAIISVFVLYRVIDRIYHRFNRKLSAKRGELDSDELKVLEKIKLWMIKPRNIVIIVTLFAIGFIVAGLISSYYLSDPSIALIIIGFLYIVAIIFVFVRDKVTDKIYHRFNRKISTKRSELGIDKLKESIEIAKQTADKAVIKKGILPELRAIINMRLIPSYATSLTILTAPGLAEVFDPKYEIPTKSKEKLHRLLNSMPGGSIGIAGPRGAGKTTLLWSFCEESVNKFEGRPVLSVLTSAPVEYEARDFILHIFASVCERTLNKKGKRIQAPSGYIDTLQEPLIKTPFTNLLLSLLTPMNGLISFLTGLSLTVLSIYIAHLVANATPLGATNASTPYITALGVNPGTLLQWGIFFTVFGLLLLFKIPKRIIKRFDEQREKERARERYESEHRPKEISEEAQQWLNRIKFQQSYSSGWSGSLKFPIAVEGGVNTTTSLSQNQLSLPEIIAGYRDFLELVSREYMVVIGIDELDKLQSDEKAHRFLNEIKAIFGVKNCFYLISVSESAMSTFERRGLPFRNVFDSSFDDIIYVNYLSSEAAEKLIKRRVIGMPIPFVYFCYCMSGGLARDLIRTCRDLLELVRVTPTKNSLSTLCSSLIRADMKSKLRAISITAKDIKFEPDMTQLLEEVHQLETALPTYHSLLKDGSDLLCGIKQGSDQQHRESEEVLVECEKLASLRDELGAYLYYLLTLEEFFNEDIDVEIFKGDEGKDACKQLAKARQYLVFSPNLARSVITDFRKSHNMDIHPTPNEKTIS